MTARRRLPNRRGSTTFPIESQGLAFTVTDHVPFQMMVNAKELPTVEFADYTFVFPQ